MICSKICARWILFSFMAVLLCAGLSFSDQNVPKAPPDWDPVMGPPIEKTPWEAANEHLVDYVRHTDDPPPPPVVNPGEWEPMTGVLIRYPLGLPVSLVAEMSEDVEVMTIVSGTSQQSQAYNQYQSGGVNMANCTWLIAPSNSMWTRDYGPWYIFTGNDEQGITDHIYNRPWRPDDDNIPWVLGAAMNIPVYGMPVIHTGGNYMSDGMGISMSTDLVYDENPSLTQAQVDNYLYEYCGVVDYDVVPDILSGGIHHIDCWAKMLDPGRILAKRLDPPNPTLEANVAYWESKISSYGRPYEVIRIDCYPSTPYTNSLILNNKVLVPLFGGSLDAQAMQTYADAMPGYEILGYYGSWVSDDAIHCRAMGMTDRYMLRIVHVPLFDQINSGQDYPVEATIHAYSNELLLPDMPVIMWKVEGGAYNSTIMTNQGGDLYAGYIPAQPDYTTIYYYIHAEDESGRSENHPYIGAGNPHHFQALPANALEIVLTPENPPIVIPATGGSFAFNIAATNNGSSSVTADVWCNVTLPNGSMYGPTLGPVTGFTFPGNWSTNRDRTQNVPGGAPAGDYTYHAYVGLYPNVIYDQDSFDFSKLGVSAGDEASEGWFNNGEFFTELLAQNGADMPTNLSLFPAYPDPFNPTTTIRFALQDASHVELTVYNLQGRMITKLVDGMRVAGIHDVTFDASNLASGLYFYQIQAGDNSAVGKMMLIK